MKFRIILAVALIGVAAPASAMTVAEFMAKVDALKAKGPLALFSSDIGVLKAEGMSAGESIKRDQETALAAGRPAPTCVPKGSKLGQNELLTYFGKIPPAQARTLSVKQGMVGLIRQKWPCR
ncbi:Rap1a immunity protein domain-containing protein [Sphingomonas antarctica]|uniref:hypothetical protein n=1 Tax=Sphingomonas antarctica TaxID=2040274 RepID=UPI0039EA716E